MRMHPDRSPALYASVKQLLVSLLTAQQPIQIASIQLLVPRIKFDACVREPRPACQIIQAPTKIERHSLTSWIDTTWDRVNRELNAHEPYWTGFLEPDEATSAEARVFSNTQGGSNLQNHIPISPFLLRGRVPVRPP